MKYQLFLGFVNPAYWNYSISMYTYAYNDRVSQMLSLNYGGKWFNADTDTAIYKGSPVML